jgi:phosphoribosylformylglycinamidine synthase
MVRTNTLIGSGCDASVVLIKGTNKALSSKTDCNGRYVYLNPKEGAKIAVAESARNVVCSGGVPLAITNCLNFGNPYKPEVYWQFAKAIEGMGEACRYFNTPVTGGNVSFYNESPDASVYPTPVIGMLGLIEDLKHITTSYFKDEGDVVYLLGQDHEEIGGSEYLKIIHRKVLGNCPNLNLEYEKKLHDIVLGLIRKSLIKSAHDVSDGGILCALAECSILNREKQLGAELNIPIKTREDLSFFSESQSRVIVSVSPNAQIEFEEYIKNFKFQYTRLGKVGGKALIVNSKYEFSVAQLNKIYFNTISMIMGEKKLN